PLPLPPTCVISTDRPLLCNGVSSESDMMSALPTLSQRLFIASREGSSKFSTKMTFGSLSMPASTRYLAAKPGPSGDPTYCTQPSPRCGMAVNIPDVTAHPTSTQKHHP